VVANPIRSFARGRAIRDIKFPPYRVGTEEERGRKVPATIYRPLSLIRRDDVQPQARTAELINTPRIILATKITFITRSPICRKGRADVQEVARGIGLDNRIGTKFLHSGPGFGGSCFRRTPAPW